MFGISFSELLLVSLVALLVLGPERLPGAACTTGLWIGRLKRSFNTIKKKVEREINADEIRQQLRNEHILLMKEEAKKVMDPLQLSVPAVLKERLVTLEQLVPAEPQDHAPINLSNIQSKPVPQPSAPHDSNLPTRVS